MVSQRAKRFGRALGPRVPTQVSALGAAELGLPRAWRRRYLPEPLNARASTIVIIIIIIIVENYFSFVSLTLI